MVDVKDQAESTDQSQADDQVSTQGDNQEQPTPAQEDQQSVDSQPEFTPEQLEKLREENENYKKALREERRKRRRSGQDQRTFTGQQQSGTQQQPQDGQQRSQAELAYYRNQTATFQLKEGAEKVLRDFPNAPDFVKTAIRRNPKGFINPETSSVEDGIEDIREHLEDLQDSWKDPKPPKKEVKVAGGNTPSTQSGANPAEIQSILETPVDEWTKEQRAKLKEYKASHT